MNIDNITKYKIEKGKGQKILDAFDCDINWQALMMNRKFLVAIIKTIFKEAGLPKDVRFSGAFVYGSIEEEKTGKKYRMKDVTNIRHLEDEETVDLVSYKLKAKHPRRLGKQHIYNSFEEFIAHRKPMRNKKNIYFFGDAYSPGEYVSVHWTCFIIDLTRDKPVVVWFDPVENEMLDFKNPIHTKKALISDYLFSKGYVKTVQFMTTTKSPQQLVCTHPAQDVFCQTWVLMFMAVYISSDKELYIKFSDLDYPRWQNEPLKLWLNCLRKKMPKTWESTLYDEKYKGFFTICRRKIPGSKYDVKLRQLKAIPLKKDESCIESVINYFYKK